MLLLNKDIPNSLLDASLRQTAAILFVYIYALKTSRWKSDSLEGEAKGIVKGVRWTYYVEVRVKLSWL